MADNKPSTRTVVNKTLFCIDRENTIRIDGTIIKTTVPTQNGSFANYETGYFIKVHNHAIKDKEDARVYLGPSTALAMASHILDQLAGRAEGNFEALVGNGGANILRAGNINQGPGVSITIGSTETFGDLGVNGLRGFAELMKITVANVEAKMIDIKAKDDYKKWKASQANKGN